MSNNKYYLDESDFLITRPKGAQKTVKVCRIIALCSFSDVEKGSRGGYIEREENLSTTGDAWVYDSAIVCEDARVCGNAKVRNEATATGNATISDTAIVFGNAHLLDKCCVCGDARVFGKAFISGKAIIKDSACVFGESSIGSAAKVYDWAMVSNLARIHGKAHVYGRARITNATITDNVRVYRVAKVNQNVYLCGNKKIVNKEYYSPHNFTL